MKAWQVGVTNVGATSSSTMAWRSGGQLRLTVMVKSVFAFTPNDSMTVAPPEDILDADASDNPAGSIRVASDRYPFRPRADVVLRGYAYAPGGVPAKRISARIAIAHGSEKSLDKVIDVVGDRSSFHADPVPFTKMPITYERAYGGAGFDPNPVGVGFGPNAHIMPNIIYPQGWNRDTEPAGFGPIAATWSRQRRLSGAKPIDFLSKTVTDIPADLDVSSFQCAPEDQRIPQLHGGEWILLENLHPNHPRLTMRLPDARGAAMVFGQDGVDTPIAMRADTLLIDADRGKCIVTFRGSHPIPNESVLDQLRIAAGVEVNRIPIDWTEAKKAAKLANQAPPGTTALDPNAPILFSAPYAIAEPRKGDLNAPHFGNKSPAPIPGAPFSSADEQSTPAPIPAPSAGGYSTIALSSPGAAPPNFDALSSPTVSPGNGMVRLDDPSLPSNPPAFDPGSLISTSDPLSPTPAPLIEKKAEWSWATPETQDSSMQQKPQKRSAAPERPAEPPARAVIYSGFTRKK